MMPVQVGELSLKMVPLGSKHSLSNVIVLKRLKLTGFSIIFTQCDLMSSGYCHQMVGSYKKEYFQPNRQNDNGSRHKYERRSIMVKCEMCVRW